jgi:hypothetical protein
MDYVNGGQFISGRHHVVTVGLAAGLELVDETRRGLQQLRWRRRSSGSPSVEVGGWERQGAGKEGGKARRRR